MIKQGKIILLTYVLLAFSFVSQVKATELTNAFVKDSPYDLLDNAWDEPKTYKPEPVLFIHGFNSHCNTWGSADTADWGRLSISSLMNYYKMYQLFDDYPYEKLKLSKKLADGREEIDIYKHVYLETIEFTDNLGHPKEQAKELAYRIMYDNDNPSSWPFGWPKPKDSEQGGFTSILKEYYSGGNWSNSSNNLILVAHSMGGMAAREFLTDSSFESIAGPDRHVSKLIMIGTPNFGSTWAALGRAAVYVNSDPKHAFVVGSVSPKILAASLSTELIANMMFDWGVLRSEAVKAMNPCGDYVRELYNKSLGHPNMDKCRPLAGYVLSKLLYDAQTAKGRIKSGGIKLVSYVQAIDGLSDAMAEGNGETYAAKWLVKKAIGQVLNSDGVVSVKSQLFRTTDKYFELNAGLIDPAKTRVIDGASPHMDSVTIIPGIYNQNVPFSETGKYDDILSALDDTPVMKLLSPQESQVFSGNKMLIEGKFYDYLPASAIIKVYAGIKEIGLAKDKTPKPIDITNTAITENGKYNAGFSFEVDTNEIGTATFIVVTITNPGANKTSQVVLININPPAQTQIYYRHKDGSQQLVPKGTQVVLTKIFPNGALEEYVEQTLVGDNGWIKFNHIPTLNEYGKSNLRYRIIVDSINKEPNSQMPRSTVTVGETGNMYRLISPVVYFKRGDFDEDGTIDEGYRTVYPDSSVREVVIEEDSVGVVTSGYLTTQSYEFGVPFSGVITYHNKPQVGNILKSLNKAHLFLANYDQSSKVISCGYSKDKDLTLSGITYYGYNANYTKKRLFINSFNQEEWNQDAILQAFGNMLSNRYFRLGQNYFPQWGANTTSEQALVNGWSQYFNAMSADSKKIKINGIERDLGSPLIAKGIANEQAIVGALVEIGRFDLIWPKVMENFNAGKSILNINDLYEVIKDQNFSPADAGQIFVKYGLKPKLVSVNNSNTTRPMFTWSRNDTIGGVGSWEFGISSTQDFSNIIYSQPGINAESLDMSAAGGSIAAGLSEGQYFWRVKAEGTSIDNFYSLNGQFNVNPSYISIASTGGSVPISGGGSSTTTPVSKKAVRSSVSMVSGNIPGTLEIPAGAVNGEVKINVTPITTSEKLGDYIVLGQKLYEIYPDEYTFQKACTIKFNLSAFTTEVNGCGIYRYNFQTKDWDFVGADYDSTAKTMSANTNKLGIYGVLRDTKAPEITNIVDSPDPFSPNGDSANDTTTFNYELNKACNVSIHIVGGDADVTLAAGLQKTRMNHPTWDGKDNQGKVVADGKYSYTITATDLLGGQTSATGTTFVFTQKPGTINGRVLNIYDARIRMVGSTLETRTDASGNFTLTDVPPSTISPVNIEVLKKGYFREVFENISLAAGQNITLNNVELSDQAVIAHRVTPDEFSPNNDGYKDQLYLNYTLNRKVPITMILSSKGVEAYRYKEEKDMGNNVTTWDGYASAGKIAKSGYYTYQIYAQAEEENILQAQGTFILNNGLLKNIRCLNELFSPNGDGRDDTCEIAYEMDNNGIVDLKIYNSENLEIVSLMDKVTRIPGNYSIEWDGKDKNGQLVADGSYTYKITSYFEEGMLSNTQTGSITVDQNPPQLSNLTPVNGSHTTNVMPVIKCKITTDQPVSDIENDRLRMKIDDFYVPISYTAATGEIVFAPETSLGVGEHIIVVYAADRAGNEAAPLSNVFYIDSPGADNIKPQIKELTVVGLVQTINGFEVYSGKPSVIAKLFDENSSIDTNSISLEIDGERVVNQSKTIDIMHGLPGGKVDSGTKKNYWLEQWLYTKEILLYNPQTGTLRFNFLEEVTDNSLHYVKLQMRDIAGNISAEKEFTFKVNIDRVSPTITELTPLNSSTIKATMPMISCKLADDKSQLDLYSLRFMLDGVEQEIPTNAFNSSNGLLEFKCPLTLEQETQHIITIDIADMAGNKATQGMSVFTVKGDMIAPVIVELLPEDGILTTNRRPSMTAILVDNGDSLVDKSSISLGIDGDNISNNNLIIQQDSVKSNTVNVSYVPAINLSDGQHLLVISAEDESNNQANSRSAMFRIGDDNVAPVIDQLKPENSSTITVVRPLISARLKDDGTGIDPSSIVLKIDGTTKQLPEGSYSSATNMLTYVPNVYLSDNAQHVVTIDAKDKAGNSAVRAISVFNIKSLIVGAANVSEIYPEAEGFSNKKPTPIKVNLVSGNGTIVPFANILFSLDNQVRPHIYNVSAGEVKFASDPVLPEGLHSIKLRAEDNVGNLIYIESSFTMDYTKPVISLTKDIRDGDYVDSLQSIDFDVVETLSGVDENSVNVTVDSKKYSGFNYLASANKLALAPAEPISDGMHTIELQVNDRATNPSDKKVLKVQIAGELAVEEVVNFPNPFPQEGTKFTCQLSKPANIRIRIYTITGELVKRIETEGQAGYNEFFWDATNDWGRKIAQGAYPYIFEADDGQKKIKIKKTCVLKR
ncbi:MAG: FlgD immunoglobulin-like domain containing protein [Dehalococcoidales bacterium]|nr:FlgD immunoglobulin-like domain containing protein [Dehalococcoidales bacterium]